MRRTCAIGAVAIALTLLGAMAFFLLGADGLVLAGGQPVFGDFIAFWSAGRAALDGRAAEVHEIETIRAYHQIAAPGVEVVAPWNSPPPFLLVAAALALLPYPAAALLFLGASSAIYLFAARKIDPHALIFAVTLPAALYHLGTVQTGLLIAGVSALALLWLDKRPLSAGALIALLAIKPHLAVLWPLLLALSGRWRAFAAAAAGTLAFTLAAGLVFGFESYPRFFENLAASQAMISGQRITTPAYASLYANLLMLGAPQTLASVLHGASAATAALLACRLFWRSRDLRAQGAALCAATLLISPYLFFYDFTLIAAGAALMGAPRDRFELAAFVLAWSAGLSLALNYIAPLPLAPLAAWLILLAAARRAPGAAYPTRKTPVQPRSARSSPPGAV